MAWGWETTPFFMERLKYRITETTILLGGLYLISRLAFTKRIRKEIGRRDGWACQYPGCGKKFSDGWMVQASHLPDRHHKSHPLYDHPSSGVILCVEHHKQVHEEGTTLGRRKDDYALRMLEQTDEMTYAWYEKNGKR